MRHLAPFVIIALCLILLAGCSDWEQTYDFIKPHLIYCWEQSLPHSDAEIAFFGDSRTIGGDWYSAYPDKKVINLGVAGDKVSDLLKRVELFDHLSNLKCCFIAIGVNDCWTTEFDGSGFKTKLNQLLDNLESRDIKVYLTTVPGITRKNSAFMLIQEFVVNINVTAVNLIIRELAEERNLELIDVCTCLADSNAKLKEEYSLDGCHYNEAG